MFDLLPGDTETRVETELEKPDKRMDVARKDTGTATTIGGTAKVYADYADAGSTHLDPMVWKDTRMQSGNRRSEIGVTRRTATTM